MCEAIMQKQVMNGSTIDMLDKVKHDKLVEKIKKVNNVFYYGDELTPYEIDVERMYITAKLDKKQTYAKRKSIRYKVRWTASDLNRYQD